MYLTCLDHDPPLCSDGEVGQHTYDLPDIRKAIANRHLFCQLADVDICPDYGSYFTNNAARFLATHRRCTIGIEDEYGRKYLLVEGEDEE
jgi:hypothetical protein